MNNHVLLERLRRANPYPDPDRIDTDLSLETPMDAWKEKRMDTKQDPVDTKRLERPPKPLPGRALRPALAAFMLMIAFGLAFWAFRGSESEGPIADQPVDERLQLVQEYQERWNAGDLDEVMALFADGTDFVGFGKDRQRARASYAVDLALGKRILLEQCTLNGRLVECSYRHTDHFMDQVGIEVRGDVTFGVEDGAITLIMWEPRDEADLSEMLSSFFAWLDEQDLDEAHQEACGRGSYVPEELATSCVEFLKPHFAQWLAQRDG